MQMNKYDACRVLGLSGAITPEIVKAAYRAMSLKYHPDLNPAGGDMMKIINAARDALQGITETIEPGSAGEGSQDYPAALNAALNTIRDCIGLHIEICGAWVWVHGDTFAAKEELKAGGFKYASKKKAWFFRPEEYRAHKKNGEMDMDAIRQKYGTTRPDMRGTSRPTLTGAA